VAADIIVLAIPLFLPLLLLLLLKNVRHGGAAREAVNA
jgi:cell division protein FtsX